MAELRLLEALSDELGNPGIGPLWLATKRKAINVTKKQVEAFVKRQGEKQIFQAVQPAKGKTVSESQDARWMMDLVVFYKQPVVVAGVTLRYILVCINVFDRYLYAETIKSKESKDVAVALAAIFRRAKKLPKLISSDQGTEFQNDIPELLRKNNIAHKQKAVGDVNAIGVVDKAIQSLKQKIAQMVTRSGTWASVLPRAVASMNKSPKSGLLHGLAPEEVRDGDPAVQFMMLQDNEKKMNHNTALGERRTTALAQTDTFRAPLPGSTSKFKRSYQATYGEQLKVRTVEAGTVTDTAGGKHALKSIKVIPLNSSDAAQRLNPNETKADKKRQLGASIMAMLEVVLGEEDDEKKLSLARAAFLMKDRMRLNGEDYSVALKKTGLSLIELVRLSSDRFELLPLEDGSKPWYYVSLLE
jgi:hypothetical protein